MRRAMRCKGVGGGDSAINARVMIDHRELRGISGRKAVEIPVMCSGPVEEKVVFEVRCERGLDIEPVPPVQVYLYRRGFKVLEMGASGNIKENVEEVVRNEGERFRGTWM